MAYSQEEEDFDPHDVDDGEVEVETSKTCQTLHEHMLKEIDSIIESLTKDERIKKITNRKSTVQSLFNTITRNTRHVVRPVINIVLHTPSKISFILRSVKSKRR